MKVCLYYYHYFNKPKEMCHTPNFFGEALFVYLINLKILKDKIKKKFKKKENVVE